MAVNIGAGFPVIYSDCPWEYSNPQDHKTSRGGTPYEQMKTEDLCAMGPLIEKVAAKDCLLFHWATYPKLKQALQVMEAWGFEYITGAYTWVKLNPTGEVLIPEKKMLYTPEDEQGESITLTPQDIILKGGLKSGQGYYMNGNAEFCLLGKRGKTTSLRVSRKVKQMMFAPEEIITPIQGHSAKPEEARSRINELTGNIPGLELFARPPARAKGWIKLGWEIDGEDIRVMLQRLIDGEYSKPKKEAA